MITWIIQNKEWLFSGAGITVLAFMGLQELWWLAKRV